MTITLPARTFARTLTNDLFSVWGTEIENLIFTIWQSSGNLWVDEFSDLTLTHPAGTRAIVDQDPDKSRIGVYFKEGASGSGVWVKKLDFIPGTQIVFGQNNASSAQTFAFDTSPRFSGKDQLVIFQTPQTNDANVRISFDGAPSMPIQNTEGENLAAGMLNAGDPVMGFVNDDAFIIFFGPSAILQAAQGQVALAEQAASTAQGAATNADQSAIRAETAATTAENSVATSFGIKPYSSFAAAFADSPSNRQSIDYVSNAGDLNGVGGRVGRFIYKSDDMSSVLLGGALNVSIDSTSNTLTASGNDLHTGQAVLVSQNAAGLTTNAFYYVISQQKTVLDFDGKTSDFTVGQVLTGATSGATATIISVTGSGANGQIEIGDVSGQFENNETVTDPQGGSASVVWTQFNMRDPNRFKLASTFANAFSRTSLNLTADANVTLRQHCDPMQGVYVTRDDDLAGTNGAFCRVRPDEETSEIRHFGAEFDNIQPAIQAAIFYQEFLSKHATTSTQNQLLGREVVIPAGRWRCAELIRIRQGGIRLKGAGKGVTVIQQINFASGFVEFRHPNSRDGQNINNNGLSGMTITSGAHVKNIADTAVRAVLCKHFVMPDVKIENFSNMVTFAAVEEPVHVNDLVMWQDNALMSGGEMLRIEVYNVQAGVAQARVDPETGASLMYASQIFMDNTEYRTRAGATESCLVIQGVDGLECSNAHLLGGTNQIRYASVSSVIPIANVEFNSIFFDGAVGGGSGGGTVRCFYAPQKTYINVNADIEVMFHDPKFNDASSVGVVIENEDMRNFAVDGGRTDKMSGAYGWRIAGGAEICTIQNHKFEIVDGQPNVAVINLQAEGNSMFRAITIANNKFFRRRGAANLPARMILVDDDGSNTATVVAMGNVYDSDASLSQGFLQHNFPSGGSVTVIEQDNVPLAA